MNELIKINELIEFPTGTFDICLTINGEKYVGVLIKKERILGEEHEINA